MRHTLRLSLIVLLLAASGALGAAPFDFLTNDDDIPPARSHFAEVPRYREALPGEWSLTHVFQYAPRYITATDTEGFDDALSKRFITGMNYAAFRYEAMLNYRIDTDWTLPIRPSLGLGYGYSSFTSHETFAIEGLGIAPAVPALFHTHQFSFDAGTQAGLRYRWIEGFIDYRALYAFRFQEVRATTPSHIDSQQGFVGNYAERERDVTDLMLQHSFGLGVGVIAGTDPWNYRFSLIVRPRTYMDYKGRNALLDGFGLDARALELKLSEDVAMALSLRWDFWLPGDGFNNVHFFELGIGIRFS